MKLRERNKQEKQARILQVARRLFIAQGFGETTVEQIAKEAHVAKGTIFLYAHDKRDLLIRVLIDTIHSVITVGFGNLPQGPALDQVTHVFGQFFREYAKFPQLSRLFVKEVLFLYGERQVEYRALQIDLYQRLTALLEAAKQRGELRADLELPVACANLFGVYAMVLVQWLEHSEPKAETGIAFLQVAMRQLFQGLWP